MTLHQKIGDQPRTRRIGELLNPTRLGEGIHDPHDGAFEGGGYTSPFRSPFETDGDKIVFSEGFRALADKTQVHDRTTADSQFRNRLTHSMEVSRVGRSLGNAVGARMLAWYSLNDNASGESWWRVDPTDIGHVVAAACMAHDIGNPPFGHNGEDTIASFFTSHPTGISACGMAGPQVARELRLHEGNAQGFRMISRSMGWRDGLGLNLTAATLGAFGKYPFTLREGEKKYGIHAADMAAMDRVAELTGMIADPQGGYRRHPFAWLMEAADDISYLTVDLEDATTMGMVSFDDALGLWADVLDQDELDRVSTIARNAGRGEALKFIRSSIIKKLIGSCVEIYPELAEAIDQGTLGKNAFGGGLIGYGRYGEAMDAIRSWSKANIYRAPAVKARRAEQSADLMTALGALTDSLIDRLRKGDSSEIILGREKTALRFLPAAGIGASHPADPQEAMPWLLDQITLMSDRTISAIARDS